MLLSDLIEQGQQICMDVARITDEVRDGDRLPHRRILTGSDLMKCGDRMPGKRYNGFIKSKFIKENIDEAIFMFALFKCGKSDKGRN